MNNVWKKLKGYAIISLQGFSKERFINLCGKNGIEIWNLLYKGNSVQFCIYSCDVCSLDGISNKTGCKFKIIDVLGLPVFFCRYRSRYIFAAGILFFIFAVKYLTSFVWIIDIEGNKNLTDSEILKECANQGIYCGAPIHSIDFKTAGEAVKDKFDSISWINISAEGIRILIRTAEAEDKSEILTEKAPSDIISDKDCIITEIIVQNGMPAARIGDSIAKGDLLVSGTLLPVGFEENREPTYVHSAAHIRGKCTDIHQIKIPLQYSEKRYTGKTRQKYNFEFFGKIFDTNFMKISTNMKKYDIINSVSQIKLDDDHPFPFYIVKTTYREYTSVKLTLPYERAQTQAQAALVEYIASNYPTDADIISTKLDYKKEKNCITLTAELISEQNIGIDSEITDFQEEDLLNGTAENTNQQ